MLKLKKTTAKIEWKKKIGWKAKKKTRPLSRNNELHECVIHLPS